jgi:oxygen-independent coproporphyrinogen-3 oxidase
MLKDAPATKHLMNTLFTAAPQKQREATKIATTSELVKKYDLAGPRYTSYPTILSWDTEPTLRRWLESTREGLQLAEMGGTGAAIYVHVPFCQSLCTYCGCNSRITCSTTVGRSYVKSVLQEWELYRQQLGYSAPIPLSDLHLGGGTPTFLQPASLAT